MKDKYTNLEEQEKSYDKGKEAGRREVLEELREDFKYADPITKLLIENFIKKRLKDLTSDPQTKQKQEKKE